MNNGTARSEAKRFALPRRFNAALSENAYARLRALNARYRLSNNYLLVVLLENLDRFADAGALDQAFRDFIEEYGAPSDRKHEKDA